MLNRATVQLPTSVSSSTVSSTSTHIANSTKCNSSSIVSGGHSKSAAPSSSHIAIPVHIMPSGTPTPPTVNHNHNNLNPSLSASKRGHIRSASLENANSFISKNTLGLPVVQATHTGTLKSRNEQKRMRSKYGSHNNLEEYVQQGRTKFHNIRQMFEISKEKQNEIANKDGGGNPIIMQSLPTTINTATAANLVTRTPQQSPFHQALPRRPTPTKLANGSGNRNSMADMNERLSIIEYGQQHYQQQQRQHEQQQQINQRQQAQRSASGMAFTQTDGEITDQATNLVRPIAFKPIPFEPDYSIANNRYCDATIANDRYGSTPSLAPVTGANPRFGSTTDLRHGSNSSGVASVSIGGVGGGVGCASIVACYSSSNYCNSLMARRRGSRSLKINDSMESIRHTPDSDANNQSSTIKSMHTNFNPMSASMSSSLIGGSNNLNSKYEIGGSHDQCDMTPSPSDSGVSDLEAALKDRDSELSYLRQTMEHNEKDKETFWENETKRLKIFYEGQQRDYVLKIKKMEQMLAMQQFQFKQHKLRHLDQINQYREQMADLKNELEILRSNNGSLKNSERNLRDSSAYMEEQLRETQNAAAQLRAQLEESEWKVCERNGEIALLKTQLKEANMEITMKEHAIVHLKHENTNAETQIYQSLQENHKMSQQVEEHQQQARNLIETETELRQLNKIIILKDQVILALTNELAKLRKELSDLAIFHEYGEEPSGKFTRLKQQLDNLTDICNKTRKHMQHSVDSTQTAENVLDDCNLEVIMNCLKIAPPLDKVESSVNDPDSEPELQQLNAEKRLTKMSSDIQNFVYGFQNLPDVAVNVLPSAKSSTPRSLEESTLDTLIEESANYAEEIGKLRQQLDDVRVNFELEKSQWCEEREKVLSYQKQLQTHYINMYQKLRSLERPNDV